MNKKILSILLSILMMFLFLTSCGTKITYTEEFPYLPLYPNSKMETFEPAKDNTLGKASYLVEEKDSKKVEKKYKDTLIKDNWEIDEEQSTEEAVKFVKDDHFAVVIVTPFREQTRITIITK